MKPSEKILAICLLTGNASPAFAHLGEHTHFNLLSSLSHLISEHGLWLIGAAIVGLAWSKWSSRTKSSVNVTDQANTSDYS